MSRPVRPTEDAEWASGNSGQTPAIIDPAATKKGLGWIAEKPPHQYFNWLFSTIWKWQIYIDRRMAYLEYKASVAGTTLALAPDTSRNLWWHLNATNAPITVTLPAITAGIDDGLEFDLKRVDAVTANTVTVIGTIEADVNPTFDYQWTGRGIYAHNGNWFWKY